AVPGKLILHRAEVVSGHVAVGSEATARIDADRRERTRRNHTGTHLLHWALRDVLGEHVKQAGSLVSPDRLRFDFSHYEGVPAEILARVETQANVGAEEARLRRAAELLRVARHEVPDSIERLQAKVKELTEELDTARARQAAGEAKALAAQASNGVLVVRRDGSSPDDLRRLA